MSDSSTESNFPPSVADEIGVGEDITAVKSKISTPLSVSYVG